MDVYTFSDRLFGGTLDISIFDVDESLAEIVAKEAYDEALRLEKIFNLYDINSELSILNNRRELICSDELLHVIKESIAYSKMADGLYDISLGRLFLERKGQLNINKADKRSKEEIDGLRHNLKCSYKDISIEGNRVILTHEDVLIDLGSIAKGYIVDKVVEYLEENGVESGIVDGRGDIRVFGKDEQEMDIQHPRDKEKIIETIKIKNESVATSGDYKQFKGDFNTSHIINNNNFSSVTIISKNLESADAFATVVSVLDEKKVKKLLKNHKQFKAITITKDLEKKYYNFDTT